MLPDPEFSNVSLGEKLMMPGPILPKLRVLGKAAQRLLLPMQN